MQRQKIRGADLAPNASQHVGMLNAEKCVIYLRGVGVEIDDATADAWLDTQAAHRFFQSERKPWRRVEEWSCRCGEMRGLAERGPGRMRMSKAHVAELRREKARCDSCGTGWCSMHMVFYVRRDGTVQDYRRGVDAVIPLRLDEWAGGL